MRPNDKQLGVLLIGIALFTLSELFPPWLYKDGWNSAERPAGYHFIFSPEPEVKSQAEMKKIFSVPDGDPPHGFSVRRDTGRLYGQRLIILFLMVGLLFVLSKRRSVPRLILGGTSIGVGLLFVCLYAMYVVRY